MPILSSIFSSIAGVFKKDDDQKAGIAASHKVDTINTPPIIYDKSKLICPRNTMITLTQDGVDMIVYNETGGKAYYDKFLAAPNWPVAKRDWDNQLRNKSGVTIGIGYDLGQETTFGHDWARYLSLSVLQALYGAVGLQRRAAQAKARELRDAGIRIPWEIAVAVFMDSTLPQNAGAMQRSYPGIERLHPNVQAAVLSMVYQWGSAVRLNAQREIKRAVQAGFIKVIADNLRAMKGMASSDTNRRELEARYAMSAINQPVIT